MARYKISNMDGKSILGDQIDNHLSCVWPHHTKNEFKPDIDRENRCYVLKNLGEIVGRIDVCYYSNETIMNVSEFTEGIENKIITSIKNKYMAIKL